LGTQTVVSGDQHPTPQRIGLDTSPLSSLSDPAASPGSAAQPANSAAVQRLNAAASFSNFLEAAKKTSK
jgi:hypothetical protein